MRITRSAGGRTPPRRPRSIYAPKFAARAIGGGAPAAPLRRPLPGAERAMQMDPAVRTIAISCATAIIGYISSSLLNMRAARPVSHMRRQLWRHGLRWAAWRHRTRRHCRGATAEAPLHEGAALAPLPRPSPPPSRPLHAHAHARSPRGPVACAPHVHLGTRAPHVHPGAAAPRSRGARERAGDTRTRGRY